MPRLWNETIEAHRTAVRDAILDTTAAMVAEQGLLSVTMSQIAEQTAIGRATLYKYFADVEAILLAWHERQITAHLEYLAAVRDQSGSAGERLEAVLQAYALLSFESHGHHDPELAAFLHRDDQVARAQRRLQNMIRDLLAEGAETGDLRDDVAPDELASYCLNALTANGLPSKAAVLRLVRVTLAGLHPGTARAQQLAASEESGQGRLAAGAADRQDHPSATANPHGRHPHGGHIVKPSRTRPPTTNAPD